MGLDAQILIFCEGPTDQIFIADCLERFYNTQTKRIEHDKDKIEISFKHGNMIGKIIGVGGCDMLRKKRTHTTDMSDNTEVEGINVVIFDADFDANAEGSKKDTGNKGIIACRQKLNAIKNDFKVEFDNYIWPDDNKEGEVEDLLRKLIPVDKQPIMGCIEGHQICLKQTNIPNLRIADLKTMLGYYLFTQKEKDTEGRNRKYQNTEFWNLDTTKDKGVPDLIKFKTFLDRHFENESDS